jgi:hypothetical protein
VRRKRRRTARVALVGYQHVSDRVFRLHKRSKWVPAAKSNLYNQAGAGQSYASRPLWKLDAATVLGSKSSRSSVGPAWLYAFVYLAEPWRVFVNTHRDCTRWCT